MSNNDVKITVPARSAVYMLVERNMTVTPVIDIDPAGKLIQIVNNPSSGGAFSLKLNGFTNEKIDMAVIDAAGKLIYTQSFNASPFVHFDKKLAAGLYTIKLQMKKGTTVKKMIVY